MSRRKRADSMEGFAVVFFCKLRKSKGGWEPFIGIHDMQATLAQTPEVARQRFMDNMAPKQSWRGYHNAGWRVRKLKVTDLGDA